MQKNEPLQRYLKGKRPFVPVCGTVERWQHGGKTMEPTDQAGVWTERALIEHLLDDLCLAQVIDASQRDAGLRFKNDFQEAGLEARMCSSYNPNRGGTHGVWHEPERSEAEERAYRRWRDAMRALGPLADCLVNVACFDQSPRAEDSRKLRYGLEILKAVYGVAPRAPLKNA